MQLINVRFDVPGDVVAVPERLRDLLYDSAEPGDLLEHVYAESRHGAMDASLFLTHPSADEALVSAVRICRRCLRRHRVLAGWRLARYGVGVLDPGDPAGVGPP